MHYIIKVILSSSLPFLKEALFGSDGHPFRGGKKRKGDKNHAQAILPIVLFVLLMLATDLLEKRDALAMQTLRFDAMKKELATKEKKNLALEGKYEKIDTELSKLDTLNFRLGGQLKDSEEDYDEMKELYRKLFNDHQKLKKQLSESCANPDVSLKPNLDLGDIKERLERLNRGKYD